MPEHIRQEPRCWSAPKTSPSRNGWHTAGGDRRQRCRHDPRHFSVSHCPRPYDDKLNIASAADDAGNWVALEMGHLLEPLVARIFAKKTGLEVFPDQENVPTPAVSLHAGRCGLLCPPAKRKNFDSGNQNDQLQRKRPLVEGRRGMFPSTMKRRTPLHDRYGHRRNLLLLPVWQQ